MRLFTWWLAFVLAAASPYAAVAQPAGADKSFEGGRAAMAKGDYKTALELLRESHKLAPGRGKLANIALCEAKLGLIGSAVRHMQEVLQELPEGDARREPLMKQMLELQPKVPYLRVRIAPGAPAGTAVTLDGEALSASQMDASIPVDPGKHVVVAKAAGAQEKRYELVVELEERRVLTVEPTVAAAAPPPPPKPLPPAPKPVAKPPPPAPPVAAAPSMTPRRAVGIAGVTVGSAGLGLGAILGGIAVVKHSDLAKSCPDSVCPHEQQATLQPKLDTLNAFRTASTVSIVAGGVLAAAGVVTLVTTPKSQPKTGVVPVIGPGWLGAEGRF